MEDRIMTPKDAWVLLPVTYEYVASHGKGGTKVAERIRIANQLSFQ